MASASPNLHAFFRKRRWGDHVEATFVVDLVVSKLAKTDAIHVVCGVADHVDFLSACLLGGSQEHRLKLANSFPREVCRAQFV